MHHCPDIGRPGGPLGPSAAKVDPAAIRAHVEACDECREDFDETRGDAAAGPGGTIDSGPEPTLADREAGGPAPPRTDLYGTYFSAADHGATLGGAGPGRATMPTEATLAFGPGPKAGPAVARESAWPEVPGYELLSRLGQGGMGVVFKARQLKLNRLVALKMIRDSAQAGPLQLARFRIEAEAVARLHHPNIVQIYEIGEVDGLPFFSLELLGGGGLDARLAGAPQPRREAAEMVAALASAIQAAHQARVIHRDLKPANVVLADDGTPKITDFGLAKRLEEEEQSQTRTGEVMGSPSYMSPEQALGKLDLVGPAADIYALGAILYEMLTGRPPFRGATGWETVKLVVEEEPVPPSRLQPRIPRDLETICLKCLLKEPGRRYATAQELADDLRRFLADEPILARPISLWGRGVKWARRRPAIASLSALAATMLAGLVGIGIWYTQDARRREADRADRANAVYVAGRDELDAGLRESGDNPGRAVLLLQSLRRTLADQPQATLREPRFVQLAHQVASLHARVEAAEAARKGRDRFEADRDRFRGLRDEALLLDSDFAGLDLAGRGRGGGAGAAGAKAIEALEVFAGPGGEGSLATLPGWLSGPERKTIEEWCSEMLLIRAEALARTTPGADPRPRAEAALRVLARVAVLAPDIPPTLAHRRRRAEYLEALGEDAAAAREREEAASLQPRGAFDHFLLGRDLSKQGDHRAAAREYREATKADSGQFWPRFSLAIAELNTGRPEVARVLLDNCVRERPGWAGPLLLRGFARGQAALAAMDRSGKGAGPTPPGRPAWEVDFDDAEADFAAALAALGPGDGPLRYALLDDRGLVRFWRGRDDDAEADFEAAIRLDPGRFNARNNLAGVALRRGDLGAAIGHLSAAIGQGPGPASLASLLRFRAYVLARQAEVAGQAARRDGAIARAVAPIDPVAAEAQDRLARACRRLESEARRGALADLDAIPRGPDDRPSEAAGDLVKKAELLTQAGRPGEALAAADAALRLDPRLASAHRWRIGALLGLEKYAEVVRSCDAYLPGGRPSAELHAIRGQARARTMDLEGAIDDYTQSLALRPGQASVLVDRGWARFSLGELGTAFRDFDQAIRIEPGDGDAFSGRGNVRVSRGQAREAVDDAAEALARGERTPLKLYRCARIFAQAGAAEIARAIRDGRLYPPTARGHNARAVALLREALERLPSAGRDDYRAKILVDAAFRSLPPPVDLLPRREAGARASAARPGPSSPSR